ncbi:hypothetical protein M0220_13475 [Halomonas qinghailakensis]|uniref:Sulfotransferase n=1 Tax=Halomonas qinghailakensis TaxID=2937790 RepID=A0AA46TP25_9GAMM|nr:hypothetical protein [Halomonas sp. ZZQ-149]UYO73879.1 hypothetical protein M0220_13475 [Halomonas sp. ZZQ-149]
MNVVQIIGPSYCGSTVLGYALNTVPGFFFASEVKRVLYSYRKNNGFSFPVCDFCGESCHYWSSDFFNKINNVNDLKKVYQCFSESYPDVEFFVDSSKLISDYKGTNAFAKIVCVKHPVRMLASQLYNVRKKININVSSYAAFKSILSEEPSYYLDYSKLYLDKLCRTYSDIKSEYAEFFYFKTDLAHLEKMKIFDDLMNYLGVCDRKIDVENFSSYRCHSLGGNRAPVNLMKKKNDQFFTVDSRSKYYDKALCLGDWKIDEKYKELLPRNFLDEICESSEFKKALKVLEYSNIY